MQTKKKVIQVSQNDYYHKYFKAINGFLGLTEKQINFLSLFLTHNGDRKLVERDCGIGSQQYENYLNKMKEMGVLTEQNNISPYISFDDTKSMKVVIEFEYARK